jgi:hypothetical protein
METAIVEVKNDLLNTLKKEGFSQPRCSRYFNQY